jgi:hypothetical protein
MPRSRSTFIQSDRARRCSPRALTAPAAWLLAARLDRAGGLDRAAEQQQLFRQRRLAGVRMRDDRKGTPPCDDIVMRRHVPGSES